MDTRSGEIFDPAIKAQFDEARKRLGDKRDADYLMDMLLPPTPYQRETKKVARNDPCPCGSQRKFKRCCWGKIQA